MVKRFVIGKGNEVGKQIIKEYTDRVKNDARIQTQTTAGILTFMESRKPAIFREMKEKLEQRGFNLKTSATSISVSKARIQEGEERGEGEEQPQEQQQQPRAEERAEQHDARVGDDRPIERAPLVLNQAANETQAQRLFRMCLMHPQHRRRAFAYEALGYVNQETALYVGYGLLRLAQSSHYFNFVDRFSSAFAALQTVVGVATTACVLRAIEHKIRTIPLVNEGLNLLGVAVRNWLMPVEGVEVADQIRNAEVAAVPRPRINAAVQTIDQMIHQNIAVQMDGIDHQPVPERGAAVGEAGAAGAGRGAPARDRGPIDNAIADLFEI